MSDWTEEWGKQARAIVETWPLPWGNSDVEFAREHLGAALARIEELEAALVSRDDRIRDLEGEVENLTTVKRKNAEAKLGSMVLHRCTSKPYMDGWNDALARVRELSDLDAREKA